MGRLSTFMPYLLLSCCFLGLALGIWLQMPKVFRRYQKVTQLLLALAVEPSKGIDLV